MSDHGVTMEQITGIGGVLFRAKDPEALSTWYEDTFGVSRAPRDYGTRLDATGRGYSFRAISERHRLFR
jgi:hypothetical protein